MNNFDLGIAGLWGCPEGVEWCNAVQGGYHDHHQDVRTQVMVGRRCILRWGWGSGKNVSNYEQG